MNATLCIIALILILSILAIAILVCCFIKFRQRIKKLTNEMNEIVANYNNLVKERIFNRKLIKQQKDLLQQAAKIEPSEHSLEQIEAAQSLNKFALDVYLNLSEVKNDSNLLISPFSISIGLAMLLKGAGKQTEAELKNLLKQTGLNPKTLLTILKSFQKKNNHVSLKLINKIYFNDKISLNKRFIKDLTKKYSSKPESLNYLDKNATLLAINDWVAGQTNNKIKRIIADISAEDMIVLVNTMYLKAAWLCPFSIDCTSIRPFYLADGQEQNTRTMFIENAYYAQFSPLGINAETFELPFDCKLSMTIILPKYGSTIKELENELDSKTIDYILNRKNSAKRNLRIYLPKFKIDNRFIMNDLYEKLGLSTLFDAEKAYFSAMSSDSLAVSKVVQRTCIVIDEKGAEMTDLTDPVKKPNISFVESDFEISEFDCNKPFMYIVHQAISREIMFIGKFMKPFI